MIPYMVSYNMAKADKILTQMKHNPKDNWGIEDLKRIAERYEIDYRQPSGSHVTFRTKGRTKLTIPARKPIKEFYIKQFVNMIENEEENL